MSKRSCNGQFFCKSSGLVGILIGQFYSCNNMIAVLYFRSTYLTSLNLFLVRIIYSCSSSLCRNKV